MNIRKYMLIFFMIVLCVTTMLVSCENNQSIVDLTETTQEQPTDDGDPFTFLTVSELKKAIKENPKYYNNQKVSVTGTIREHNNDILLVDYNLPSYNAQEYYKVLNDTYKHIKISISDDILLSVLETGDYIKLNGRVRIAKGEIYLDNCEYTMLITCDER